MKKYWENRVRPETKMMLVAGILASSIFASATAAQAAAPSKPVPAAGKTDLASSVSGRAHMYYQGAWGVDSFRVKYTESGEIIRFSYRVVDPEKAAALNDKKSEPTLIDPRAGVSLVVPEVSNVGKMRQTSTPKAGMTYWMAFSNSGRPVKRGDRVDVVIGKFRVTGLEVE
jgi:hypothetical protein